MPSVQLPARLPRPKREKQHRLCPSHRAWVRRHRCSVPRCERTQIECAHVRIGTDGGQGLKPSDRFCLSLCADHHAEQHRVGEREFERRYGIDLLALAAVFARTSPYWRQLTTSVR